MTSTLGGPEERSLLTSTGDLSDGVGLGMLRPTCVLVIVGSVSIAALSVKEDIILFGTATFRLCCVHNKFPMVSDVSEVCFLSD